MKRNSDLEKSDSGFEIHIYDVETEIGVPGDGVVWTCPICGRRVITSYYVFSTMQHVMEQGDMSHIIHYGVWRGWHILEMDEEMRGIAKNYFSLVEGRKVEESESYEGWRKRLRGGK